METSLLENMAGYGKKTITGLSLLYIGLSTPYCGRGGHSSNNTPSAPNMPNNPPVAKAIFSYSTPINREHPTLVNPHNGVVLDGSCSSDPDGDHMSYSWSMNKKPAGSTLTDKDILNRDKPHTLFFPDVEGDYTLELRVTDERGASSLAYIAVSVQKNAPARPETPPVRNPGYKKKAKEKPEEPKGNDIGKKKSHIPTSIRKIFKKK